MTETTQADTPQDATGTDAAGLLLALAESLGGQVAYFELPSKRCCFANLAYAHAHGFTIKSILGRTPKEVVGATAWKEIAADVQRCFCGERVKYLREWLADDGSLRVVSITLTPHFDAEGVQDGVLSVTTDSAARLAAESAIRESEERTRKFAEATEEAIVFHTNFSSSKTRVTVVYSRIQFPNCTTLIQVAQKGN